MEKDYSLISFILRAKRRRKVFELFNEPKTPKQLAGECKISISNVSNSLAELKEKELIEILNPKDHLTRFYQQTNKGKEFLKMLKNSSMQ